jgi:GTP-binding protein HflX
VSSVADGGADGADNGTAGGVNGGWPARTLIVTDTVGFIRRLPHDLVNAFHSTLEELSFASVLINVLDASSPDAEEHYRTTMSVLKDLGQEEKPCLTALNKIDAGVEPEAIERLAALCPAAVPVSARTGEGLPLLLKKIEEALP